MNQKLKEKISEAFTAVLPITALVLVLSFTVSPMPIETIFLFLWGAAMLIVGTGFFSMGVDTAMTPMGEALGSRVTKMKNIFMIIAIFFVLGIIITVAEPDLQVLAGQVPSIPNMTMIWVVALGVGVFLVFAVLRVFLQIKLNRLLIIFYLITFILSIFTPGDFIAMAFDSGGVTTGPITVPFIMALGVGLSLMRSDNSSQEDSFGLTAICSIGPIIAVMILGIIYRPSSATYQAAEVPQVGTTHDVIRTFLHTIPEYCKEILMALAPIVLFLLVFQLFSREFRKRQMIKLFIGFGYTFIGLVLFLTGANVGFMPAGNFIGVYLAESSMKWILIPVGAVIGYFSVAAEPSVHVLNKQVEEVSSGAIPQKAMGTSLSIGVSVSVALSMLRILTGISIYWVLIPGYAIALILSFFVPRIFTGIAFDSGGVASGTIAATFVLPFAMGACEGVGGNILTDAFGCVAFIAMTPLVTIQILGLIYKKRMALESVSPTVDYAAADDEIIEFDETDDDITEFEED